MAKLIYVSNVSLDGFIEDEHGGFEWTEPDDEQFAFVTDLIRPVGTYLYGRRLYETMAVWETESALAAQSELQAGFAHVWQAAEKIVYSSTLQEVSTANSRLERRFDPDAVRHLKAAASRDLMVGGANLAAHAFNAELIEESHLFICPAIVGRGKPSLPSELRAKLELLDERRFDNGVVYVRSRRSHRVTLQRSGDSLPPRLSWRLVPRVWEPLATTLVRTSLLRSASTFTRATRCCTSRLQLINPNSPRPSSGSALIFTPATEEARKPSTMPQAAVPAFVLGSLVVIRGVGSVLSALDVPSLHLNLGAPSGSGLSVDTGDFGIPTYFRIQYGTEWADLISGLLLLVGLGLLAVPRLVWDVSAEEQWAGTQKFVVGMLVLSAVATVAAGIRTGNQIWHGGRLSASTEALSVADGIAAFGLMALCSVLSWFARSFTERTTTDQPLLRADSEDTPSA